MIEVTCGACGATHRLAEADVPPGGKTVTCAKCKARLQVPAPGPRAGAPGLSGGTGDVIDLADLPAPKRPSPFGNLPRPGDGPPPITAPIPKLDLDAFLPPAKPPGAAPPPPAATRAGLGPSKAPDVKLPPIPPQRPTPAASMTQRGLGASLRPPAPDEPIAPDAELDFDLPAPVGPSPRGGGADLPAPVGPSPRGGVVDLPAPVGPSSRGGEVVDLPAPVGPAPSRTMTPTTLEFPKVGIVDLPAPVGPSPRGKAGDGGVVDLPAPKRPAAGPPPPAAPALGDETDLPVPKGFFEDVPAPVGPVSRNLDLPAPKGFFDDIPQPATPSTRDNLPAPVGPTPRAEPPAPKGFFDDIPVPTTTIGGHRAGPPPAPPPPAPPPPRPTSPPPARAMDLDDLDLAPPTNVPISDTAPAHPKLGAAPGPSLDLDSEPSVAGARPTAGLDLGPVAGVPSLDLPDAADFGGLDLPAAGTKGGVVSFKPSQPTPADDLLPPPSSLDLDVIDTGKGAKAKVPVKPVPTRAEVMSRQEAKGKAKAREPRKKVRPAFLIAGGLLVALAGGGFYAYQRWMGQKAEAARVEQDLADARAALTEGAAGHWRRAAAAADHALSLDRAAVDAHALAAQAHYAAYWDEGTDGKRHLAEGGKHVEALLASGDRSPDAEKAQALKSLVDGQPDRALARLAPVVKARADDRDGLLYLGWARAAGADWKGAVDAFDNALARARKKREVPILYGRGYAKLALGDRAGARADFAAVIDRDKEHIGAQVGLADAAPPADFVRREADLLALLQRKDIAKADPRAVARAWVLAGDDARRAGRLDSARDRYRRALAIDPGNTAATLGEADTELRDGNVAAAEAAVQRALKLHPDDVAAQLVDAEVDLRGGKSAEARARLDGLRGRQPPLQSPTDRARLAMLTGTLLETEPGKEQDALVAYEEARTLFGDGDVAGSIAAARLLARMAETATDPAVAAAHRKRAEELLAPLAQKAKDDPATAVTLGLAHLAAGDAARAETWLRSAIAARPGDVEAHFQLAAALGKQGKKDEAVQALRKAFELDTSRVDVGLELARGYEGAGRLGDAGTMYEKLLANPDVSIDTRARAGRFWARTGDVARARVQGAEIRKVEPENPAGLFLDAEGLYADRKFPEARRLYQQAVDHVEDAQYLDGLGRAAEMVGAANGDSRYKEEALRAYTRASELDPKLWSALIGRGRLHLERREAPKALIALEAARALRGEDPDVLYGLGLTYQELGNRKEAISLLSRAMAAKPRAEGHYRLGILYYDLDRGAEATAALWTATKLAAEDEKKLGQPVPWLTDALYLLGSIELALRHDGNARAAWEQYLSRNPPNQTQVDSVKRQMLGLRGR